MAAMNVSQPVSSTIGAVDFHIMSPEEIRALSAKRITNPMAIDPGFQSPLPGGLYDTALGPFEGYPCTTCSLAYGCPGHCGHIDLPVPVYHPTFMDQCLRLLRAKCASCHLLKMSRVAVNLFVCKLRLTQYGLLEEVQTIENVVASDDREPDDDDSDQDPDTAKSEFIINLRNRWVKKALKAAKSEGRLLSHNSKLEAVGEARRTLIRDFLKASVGSAECKNCGAQNPGWRKDRYVKIFRRPLSSKLQKKNEEKSIMFQNPLVQLERDRARAARKRQAPHKDEAVADLDSSAEDEEEEEDVEDLYNAEGVRGGDSYIAEAAVEQENESKPGQFEKETYVSAVEVHAALMRLFEREREILSLVYSARRGSDSKKKGLTPDIFFIQTILVTPTRYRPPMRTDNDTLTENGDNSGYRNILNASFVVSGVQKELSGGPKVSEYRPRTFADLNEAIVRLQDSVNIMLDKERSPLQGNALLRVPDGVKQKLEKKEGLFRTNIMGKRVDFTARTVISPDPNLETNQIGIPVLFARKLYYAEPVTEHNFDEMREAVIRGADQWPGAVAVENEMGQLISLKTQTVEQRHALGNQLLSPSESAMKGNRPKKVHRHINNGDMVLVNRQPTLHKPSIMAHRVRILPGEKTIRMHYANCNTYNADFDGDEMNVHFPQNEIAQAEAMLIADTDHQYLSATAGKPLRGLIQDHISISVRLTNRDTFFTRDEYHQLLYSALRPEDNQLGGERFVMVPPAIMKPKPLWTGKQIYTSVLQNILAPDTPGLNLDSQAKTMASFWGDKSEEQNVIFQDGYLVCGIMDKKQIGPESGGMVHAIYETYGHSAASKTLSVVGRLLTRLLNSHSFSCGVQDIVMTVEGNKTRHELIATANDMGNEFAAKYVSLEGEKNPRSPELRKRLEEVLRDENKQAGLDAVSNGTMAKLASAISKAILPLGLKKPFPANQMQAMTGSGAKGTPVNANLISCCLGQQVLEGRRVPVMVTGKTLPCFEPFETSPRAGGFVVDRFLTGLRLQEVYFHSMAGREGLIDTAVKTAHSGYLQRCMCKNMEGLQVKYDGTVRDVDGSILQFLYGEDSVEVINSNGLYDMSFIAKNLVAQFQKLGGTELQKAINLETEEDADAYNKKAIKKYKKHRQLGATDPALAVYSPARVPGATSEKFYEAVRNYTDDNPDKILADKKKGIESKFKKSLFKQLMNAKYLRSLVEPGEAVGIIAGQSVGEPSTQMTLNTFHLAGHSAKNVTLGIPRLREIVMTATRNVKTPTMTCILQPQVTKEEAVEFAKRCSRLAIADIVDNVEVSETVGAGEVMSQHCRQFRIRLNFFPAEEYTTEYNITVKQVKDAVVERFAGIVCGSALREIKKWKARTELKDDSVGGALPTVGIEAGRERVQNARDGNGDDDEGGQEAEEEEEEDDGDATNSKQKSNKKEMAGYEDIDDEDGENPQRRPRDEREQSALPQEEESEDETYGGSRHGSPIAGTSEQTKNQHLLDRAKASTPRRSQTEPLTGVTFDHAKGAWCELTLEFDSRISGGITMLHLVEHACRRALIRHLEGVKSCTVIDEEITDRYTGAKSKRHAILTEGCNIPAMHRADQTATLLDADHLLTNSVWDMMRHYGVEAARAVIIREMDAVFSGHGISVDYRHLNLVADVMTRHGGYAAFNRMGMSSSTSPFMKMSFETATKCLRDAVLESDWDPLLNPSARLVVGKLSQTGTGMFDVLAPVDT